MLHFSCLDITFAINLSSALCSVQVQWRVNAGTMQRPKPYIIFWRLVTVLTACSWIPLWVPPADHPAGLIWLAQQVIRAWCSWVQQGCQQDLVLSEGFLLWYSAGSHVLVICLLSTVLWCCVWHYLLLSNGVGCIQIVITGLVSVQLPSFRLSLSLGNKIFSFHVVNHKFCVPSSHLLLHCSDPILIKSH